MTKFNKASNKPNNKLSVFIITKNEEVNIYDCIKSCSFADEVVVLDSGSSDATVNIAKLLGARVIKTNWPGVGFQKNRAIKYCKYNWIFCLDADERIPYQLSAEIKKTIKQNLYKVYDVPRKSFFISRFMRFSGWWPDRTKRLFKLNSGSFSEHFVHSEFLTTNPVGKLKNHLIHFSYRNVDDVLKKIQHFSSGGAMNYYKINKKSSLSKAVIHGIWAFFKTYFIRLGIFDGKEGFILSIMNAETTYYRYLKLMFLYKK
jgi:glycosyltransferase involved in cell wall biosynthesis